MYAAMALSAETAEEAAQRAASSFGTGRAGTGGHNEALIPKEGVKSLPYSVKNTIFKEVSPCYNKLFQKMGCGSHFGRDRYDQ